MIRTQIQLTEKQARSLKMLAAERNVSVAGLIRQSVDQFVRLSRGPNIREQKQRAIADADEKNHDRAKRAWIDLIAQDAWLICTNYVVVETFVLVQHQLGMAAARTLQEDVLPVMNV